MTPREEELRLDAILSQAEWLRSLAGSLVRDPGDADDVAQEALIATWARSPDDGPRRGLRPWLGAVTRNLVLRGHRDRERRERRQREAARPETLPSSADDAVSAELKRLVGEAVAVLEEPYRTTVMLRYFGGLTAAEIAKQEGVPPGTVRARLKRGLDRLREDLDRRHGGREAWSVAVVSLLERTTPTGAPAPGVDVPPGHAALTLGSGVLIMKSIAQIAAVAALLVAGAGGLWFLTSDAGSVAVEDVAAVEPTPLAAAVEELAPALEPAEVPTAGARQGVAAAPPEPVADAAPRASTLIEARLLDVNGRPLVGGRLALPEAQLEAESDGLGRAHLDHILAKDEEQATFEVSYPGLEQRFVTARLLAGETIHLGDIVLSPAGIVSGRVVDAWGNAVAGARVLVTGVDNARTDPDELRRHGPQLAGPVPEAETDDGGLFRIEGVRIGIVRVWAGAESMAFVSHGPIDVLGGEGENLHFVLEELEKADRIEGIVLTPDGAPVPYASIGYSYHFALGSTATSMAADADGRFSILLAHRVEHHFEIRDSHDRWSPEVVSHVAPGARLTIQFREPVYVELSARDSQGKPVVEFAAFADATPENNPNLGVRLGELEHMKLARHEEGRGRMRTPNVDFFVRLDAPGYALAQLGPFSHLEPPQELAFQLEPLPAIRGRVLAGGDPVANAEVSLVRSVVDSLYLVFGYRSVMRHDAESKATTDADGYYTLHLRGRGDYYVRAEGTGFAASEIGPFELDGSVGATDLDLELASGGAIEGRVLVPRGEEAEGRVVAFNHGDGKPRTLRAGHNGFYRVEGLTAGLWQVTEAEQELLRSAGRTVSMSPHDGTDVAWSCEVVEGQTTYFDLDLRDDRGARLTGRVETAGAIAASWTATLRGKRTGFTEPEETSAALDDEGRFVMHSTETGEHVLSLRALGDAEDGLVIEHRILLEPGANEWATEISLGRLQVEGEPRGDGVATMLRYVWRDAPDGVSASMRVIPDEAGFTRLPRVPAGAGAIQRYLAPGSNNFGSWETISTFDVPVGVEHRVTL